MREGREALFVGATLTAGEYLLAVPLGVWLARHPSVDARVVSGDTAHLLSRIDDGTLDFALIEGFFRQGRLRLVGPLRAAARGGVRSRSRLSREQAVGWDDLLREHLVVREVGSGTRALFEHAMEQRNQSIEGFAPHNRGRQPQRHKGLGRKRLGDCVSLRGGGGGRPCERKARAHSLRGRRHRARHHLRLPEGRRAARAASRGVRGARRFVRTLSAPAGPWRQAAEKDAPGRFFRAARPSVAVAGLFCSYLVNGGRRSRFIARSFVGGFRRLREGGLPCLNFTRVFSWLSTGRRRRTSSSSAPSPWPGAHHAELMFAHVVDVLPSDANGINYKMLAAEEEAIMRERLAPVFERVEADEAIPDARSP